MYEKKQGKKSFWYPYIKELDRQRARGQLAVESPLLWSEAELNYLTGSPTKVFEAPLSVETEFNMQFLSVFCFKLHFVIIKGEVLERAEGIKREYSELDTVWFMAGSLFQVLTCSIFGKLASLFSLELVNFLNLNPDLFGGLYAAIPL